MATKKTAPDIELEVTPLDTDVSLDLDFEDDDDNVGDPITEDLELSVDPAPAVKAGGVKLPTSLSTIEGLITGVDDYVKYVLSVIYGKNGTGKTTLLSTAAGMLILAPEDGTLSIKDKAPLERARKIRIDTWDKVEAVYWLLKNGIQSNGKIVINTRSGDFEVKYLAIDTVTKLANVAMRNVVLGDRDKDPTLDTIKRSIANWGEMNNKVSYWLQQFRELPLQNIWLFQEGSNSDDVDSEEFSIFPQANAGLRNYVLAEADIIARTYIVKTDKGVQYRLNASPNPKYVTKDRTNTLGTGAITNPDLTKLYDRVFGTQGGK